MSEKLIVVKEGEELPEGWRFKEVLTVRDRPLNPMIGSFYGTYREVTMLVESVAAAPESEGKGEG